MTPWLDDGDVRLYLGDNLDVLRQLPDRSVHMCATSPPFYGLRDYGTGLWEGGNPDCDHDATIRAKAVAHVGTTGFSANRESQINAAMSIHGGKGCPCGARRVDQQIGLEDTPDLWVERLVQVFREVRRVLRDDGTFWVEIGDSYSSSPPGNVAGVGATSGLHGANDPSGTYRETLKAGHATKRDTSKLAGTKPKDLLGQPWLLAFALRADGWWLRSEIIWARPNPMPESVTDRPTKSHSTVFLLSKQPRYFYDADAIREPHRWQDPERLKWDAQARQGLRLAQRRAAGDPSAVRTQPEIGREKGRGKNGNQESEFSASEAGANARSVWTIPTQPTPFAHFATWPEALVRRMILAGTSERGCCPECGAPWTRDVEKSESDYARIKRETGTTWKDMQAASSANAAWGLLARRGNSSAERGTRTGNRCRIAQPTERPSAGRRPAPTTASPSPAPSSTRSPGAPPPCWSPATTAATRSGSN